MHRLLTAVNTTFFASSALAGPLVMGASLPSVEEKDQDDQVVKLAEVGAKGYTLVDFYPKADTPGCTKQACCLGGEQPPLRSHGCGDNHLRALGEVRAPLDFGR